MIGYFLGIDIFGWMMIGGLAFIVVLGIAALFIGQVDDILDRRKFRNKMRETAFKKVMSKKAKSH